MGKNASAPAGAGTPTKDSKNAVTIRHVRFMDAPAGQGSGRDTSSDLSSRVADMASLAACPIRAAPDEAFSLIAELLAEDMALFQETAQMLGEILAVMEVVEAVMVKAHNKNPIAPLPQALLGVRSWHQAECDRVC